MWALLLTRGTWTSNVPCILHHEIKSIVDQCCLVAVIAWGCPWSNGAQVASEQNPRITTNQGLMCLEQNAHSGWWSLCGYQNFYQGKLRFTHETHSKAITDTGLWWRRLQRLFAGHQARKQRMLKGPNLPVAFRQGFLKTKINSKGLSSWSAHGFFWLS